MTFVKAPVKPAKFPAIGTKTLPMLQIRPQLKGISPLQPEQSLGIWLVARLRPKSGGAALDNLKEVSPRSPRLMLPIVAQSTQMKHARRVGQLRITGVMAIVACELENTQRLREFSGDSKKEPV